MNFLKNLVDEDYYTRSEGREIISNLSERFGDKRCLKIEGLITIEKVNETIEQWDSGQLKPNNISEVL